MSTYMPKASEIERNWHLIDAEGHTLGEIATEVAILLRGKNKVTFAPNADCGDFVVVINAEKLVLTGKKLEEKMYYHHTGYLGNMKKVSYKDLMEKRPEFVVEKAVKGMLPHNKLGKKQMTRLRVYRGAEHEHAAQNPVKHEF